MVQTQKEWQQKIPTMDTTWKKKKKKVKTYH